jgi:phage repressor protein C with HTH and peptisase S24 domain
VGLGFPDGKTYPGFGAPKKVKMVPLISWAQCGAHGAPDDSAYGQDGFMVFDPADPKAFAIALEGDSMAPKYEAGDIAVLYPSFPPRNGDVVVARLRNEDVMCKLFQSAGDEVILSSYNQVYQPLRLPRSELLFCYPVAKVMKTLRRG